MTLALRISPPDSAAHDRAAVAADNTAPLFIDLTTAAERSGTPVRTLRRRCEERWERVGLAKLTQPAGGGRPAWHVREDADPQLARVKFPDQIGFDYRKLTEAERVELEARRRLLKDWHAECVEGPTIKAATARYIELLRVTTGRIVSAETLYGWERRYRADGIAGLVDRRRTSMRRSAAGGGDEFERFNLELVRIYKDENQPSISLCYRIARALGRRQGFSVPGEASARRYLKRLGLAEKIRGRKGAKAFADKCASYIQRDYTKINIDGIARPMESDDIWCADHHICDVIVSYKGKLIRPWLTPWQDLRSRKIVGYKFSPIEPDSSSVLLALRDAIKRCDLSVPRYAYTDNGKDFDCYQLTGISKAERKRVHIAHDPLRFASAFGRLQIGVWHAIPYNAKAKPIERFFRTFEDQFGCMQWTYCGNKPENKPAHLAERLKKNEAPAYEDFVADAATWIERIYHTKEHAGHGMSGKSPNAIYAENRGEKRTCVEADLDVCLQLMPKPVKVGRNGVMWGKYLYGKDDPALRSYHGRLVQLFVDPDDVSKVQIRDLDGRWICETASNALGMWGQSSDQSRQIHRKMSEHNRALAKVEKRGLRQITDPMELILEDHLASLEEKGIDPHPPTASPTSMKIIRTGLEPPPPASIPLRAAVGSENVPFPSCKMPSAGPRRASALDKLMRNAERDELSRGAAVGRSASAWDKATKLREADHE